MIKKTTALILTILLFSCISCGEEGDEESDVTSATSLSAAFLTSTDIATPSNIYPMYSSEMTQTLQSLGPLYNNPTSNSSALTAAGDEEEDAASRCLDEATKDITFAADSSSLRVGFELDLVECFSLLDFSDGITVTVYSGTMKMYMYLGCTSGDYSSFDGQTLEQLSQSTEEACTSGTMSRLENSLVNLTYGLSDGENSVILSTSSISYMGKTDLNPATATIDDSTFTLGDDNINFDLDTLELEDADPSTNFTKIQSTTVVGDSNDSSMYYSSGSFTVAVNDWTGTVTNSAAATAPTYTMTSGTWGEETGSLDTLSLTNPKATFSEVLGSNFILKRFSFSETIKSNFKKVPLP